MASKRKVTITIDDAGWALLERRQRAERLDELDHGDGPLDADAAEDARLAAGSALMVDAHVVAVAVEAGGGVVVTGDHDDLERLSASYRHLAVERI